MLRKSACSGTPTRTRDVQVSLRRPTRSPCSPTWPNLRPSQPLAAWPHAPRDAWGCGGPEAAPGCCRAETDAGRQAGSPLPAWLLWARARVVSDAVPEGQGRSQTQGSVLHGPWPPTPQLSAWSLKGRCPLPTGPGLDTGQTAQRAAQARSSPPTSVTRGTVGHSGVCEELGDSQSPPLRIRPLAAGLGWGRWSLLPLPAPGPHSTEPPHGGPRRPPPAGPERWGQGRASGTGGAHRSG